MPAIFISSWVRRLRDIPSGFVSSSMGNPQAGGHGADVDDEGIGTITQQRLYQLIRKPRPINDRQFEIEFLDPGVEVFAFTFG